MLGFAQLVVTAKASSDKHAEARSLVNTGANPAVKRPV